MSTRANIVIKQGENEATLYHHHDGYPSGVGAGLFSYINEILEREDSDEIMKSPKSLAKYLAGIDDDEYEIEHSLSGDIEFLYIVNLDKREITCFSTDIWDYEGDDLIDDEKEISGVKKKIFTVQFGCDINIAAYDSMPTVYYD